MAEPALALEGIFAGYGETVVLENIRLALARGETLSVIGRNGVGKSTLLATIMGHTTLHGGSINLRGKDRQFIAGLHARPKDAWRPGIWEKTHVAKAHVERRPSHICQRALDLFDFRVLHLANKLERHMQTFHTGPSCIPCVRPHALHVFGEPFANFSGNIERDKEPHFINLRRTMSRACCVAHWRIRLRSPGYLRSATSVFLPSVSAT